MIRRILSTLIKLLGPERCPLVERGERCTRRAKHQGPCAMGRTEQ